METEEPEPEGTIDQPSFKLRMKLNRKNKHVQIQEDQRKKIVVVYFIV